METLTDKAIETVPVDKLQVIAAIGKTMAGISFVHKAGKNEFHGYKYATEGDALAALRPHLIENGLIIISDVLNVVGPDEYGNTTVKVNYRIIHEMGGEISCNFFGCGNDKNKNGIGDKGLYKALTGANKYFLLKTFQLETGDDPERDENQIAEFTPQPKAKVTPKAKPTPAPEAEPTDVDALMAQIQDELEHCSSKDEARQVWVRYNQQINQVKLQAPNREQELTQMFITAANKLK
jgi:hypothetical protein